MALITDQAPMTSEDAQMILDHLLALQVAIQETFSAKARKMGLTTPQMQIAQDIANHPGAALQDVCARLGWPKSTVSRLVSELTDLHIVSRETAQDNRRMVVLSICPEALASCQSDVVSDFFPGACTAPGSIDLSGILESLAKIRQLMAKG